MEPHSHGAALSKFFEVQPLLTRTAEQIREGGGFVETCNHREQDAGCADYYAAGILPLGPWQVQLVASPRGTPLDRLALQSARPPRGNRVRKAATAANIQDTKERSRHASARR